MKKRESKKPEVEVKKLEIPETKKERLKYLKFIPVWSCLVLLLIGLIAYWVEGKFLFPVSKSKPESSSGPQGYAAGVITPPYGKSYYLRKNFPSIEGFEYVLGDPICLVPNDTKVVILNSEKLINGETWYQIQAKGQNLTTLGKDARPLQNVTGWILGGNKKGSYISVEGKSPEPLTSSNENSLNTSKWFVIGLLIGLFIWKILSLESLDEKNWSLPVLSLEAILLTSIYLSAFYISLTNISGSDIDKASETTKMINDLLTLYTKTSFGALLVGFIFAILTARIFSSNPQKPEP